MRNLVIAFDPGGTTGVCVLRRITPQQYILEQSFDVRWADRFTLHGLLWRYTSFIQAVVVEEFRLRNNTTTMKSQINSNFPSVHIIGILELSAHQCNLLDRWHFQAPALRNSVSVDREHYDKLNRTNHSVDAYLHAKYYLATHKKEVWT